MGNGEGEVWDAEDCVLTIYSVTQTSLPIWHIHSEIVETLRSSGRLVLIAPTGSGKTTQVPQMLLDAGLAGD